MRVFIVGPPGGFAKQISQGIATDFGYECVNVGNLFKEEAQKQTELGKKIKERI